MNNIKNLRRAIQLIKSHNPNHHKQNNFVLWEKEHNDIKELIKLRKILDKDQRSLRIIKLALKTNI